MNEKWRRELFRNPGAAYRGKPFWSWNGELKKEEIIRQIHVMKEMGLGGCFMHSRSGLITEYLGDEWFEFINAGADESERIGMEAWLYDEDRWPSGCAGGMVTVEKQYRMKSIQVSEMLVENFKPTGEELLLFLAKMDGLDMYLYEKLTDVTQIDALLKSLQEDYRELPGVWKVLAFSVVEKECTSEYNGTTYIDTMNRAATERFIELTHERYAKECGERIGTSIKGIFTDEPHRGTGMGDYKEENGIITCSMAWTEDLFEEFLKRYQYDAREVLPELFYRPKGEKFAPIKHDYFDLTNNLFLERFAMPLHDWCKEHNMLLTGHVLHEDTLACQAAPHGSLMRFYEHMDIPGIDILGKNHRGYWIAKQVTSVARQMGQKWCLSEMYGGSGWEYSMREQKINGDWQALLGINVRCQHLSWYTMEGEAKRDYPGSMLHQAPWYPYYDGVESYFARFGFFMSEGTPACDVLVLNPIESAWSQSYAGWTRWIFSQSKDVNDLQRKYEEMFHILMKHHIDFDYGEEQMLEQHYRIDKDNKGMTALYVNTAPYHVVIVGGMETIRPTTLKILEEFIEAGGKVIFAGDVPTYVNARYSEEPKQLAQKAICIPMEAERVASEVRQCSVYTMDVLGMDGSVEEEVFMQSGMYDTGIGFALLNLNRNEAKTVQVVCRADKDYHLEYWDLETGHCFDADHQMRMVGDGCVITVFLPPAGTKAFVLTEEKDDALPSMPEDMLCNENGDIFNEYTVRGEYAYRLKEENVCVLDRVAWRIEDSKWSEPTEVLWADRQLRDYFGLEYRCGQMLQPWYTKKHGNQTYEMVELKYEFDVKQMPKGPVYLAGERPETMQYFLNGVRLVCDDDRDFWIDDCFKKMILPKEALRKGRNIVTIRTLFSRMTNVEAIYLIGNFGVETEKDCNVLGDLPTKIGGKNLSEYGLPFYTGEITYLIEPELYRQVPCTDTHRVYLTVQSANATLYKVKAGTEEKVIYWEPYEVDITEAMANHETIEVTVVAGRRNTFGPLHLNPPLRDMYGPRSYLSEGTEWSEEYQLLDNGLQIKFREEQYALY